MKIRSDFVTNSSSSSYCVSLYVKPVGEKESLELDFWPEGEDGTSDICIPLLTNADDFAHRIKECDDIEELKSMLLNELSLFDLFYEEIGNEGLPTEEFIEKIETFSEETGDEYYYGVIDTFESFRNGLDEFTDISEIESVSINEFFTGWGEFARDGVEDFMNEVLPEDVDFYDYDAVAEVLEDKLTEEEAQAILDQIEGDGIAMFNASIVTSINMADRVITKKYEFEDLT